MNGSSLYIPTYRECPLCRGPAYRVHRRAIDRFVSLFVLRHRFRCGLIGCGWEGRLPASAPSARLPPKLTIYE
jgi:hypothetical protein